MTNRAMVAVGLRLLALWSIVLMFQSVTIWYGMTQREVSFTVIALVVVIEVVLCVVLWAWAFPFARRLLPERIGDAPVSLDARGLVRAGACLIGLSLLAQVVPQLVRTLAFEGLPEGLVHEDALASVRMEYIVHAVQIAIGGLLMFRNDLVARWVFPSTSRDAGMPSA